MTECPNGEIRDRLPDFVHDQLSTTARATIAAHVAGCAACTAEVALLRELRGTLRDAPVIDVGRIVAALRTPPRVSRYRRRQFDWRIAAAIGAVIVGGGSVAVVSGRLRESEAPRSTVVEQPPTQREQRVAMSGISIDADLADATAGELQELLEDLEAFDGLPAGEPEPPPATPAGEEGL